MKEKMKWFHLITGMLVLSVGCHLPLVVNAQPSEAKILSSEDRVTAFRFRSDFDIDLDEDLGWAAEMNNAPSRTVDSPFRVRFEVESSDSSYRRQYSLQYRWNDKPWAYVEAHEFPYPSAASPPVSIVSSDAFFYGEAAEDLIKVSDKPSNSGAGITLAPTTPGWTPQPESGASVEWEFALVIRRWSDGPGILRNGDRISLRMVDHMGRPLDGPKPNFSVNVPERHIGGTFVETPARIGPYENSEGELYFIMEPTETDNIFMMVKSTDRGKSWFEVDAENRPRVNDLEGVGSAISGEGTIHIAHQISEAVYHHAFATSDHPEKGDSWIVDSRLIASHPEPPTQTADISIRPEGSLLAVFAAGDQIHYSTFEPNGNWRNAANLSHEYPTGFTNPSLVTLPDGSVDVAYKSLDGKGWHRKVLPDNSLTPPKQFADNLGTTDDENIAILPLVYLPQREMTVAVFRQADGYLYASYRTDENGWSEPVRVSDKTVATNAVDSEQTGADVTVWEEKILLSFISEEERDIYFSVIDDFDAAPVSRRIVSGIDGSWLRGNVLHHQGDSPVYGLIYDAGSKGGSGFNKFISIDLEE